MQYVSESARDLVRRMLTCDPEQRVTVAQALSHAWIRVGVRPERLKRYVNIAT